MSLYSMFIEMTNQSKEIVQLLCLVTVWDDGGQIFQVKVYVIINTCKLKVSKASALGGRGHIPLLHPPSNLAIHNIIAGFHYQ